MMPFIPRHKRMFDIRTTIYAGMGQLLTFPSVSYLEFEILHMALPESGPQSPAGQCPLQSYAAVM
jgi:hypothetical protein